MTQEEKQLLIKDLCARLPYGVIVHRDDYWDKDYPRPNEVLTTHNLSQYEEDLERWNLKPYLRPLSSMTEEEIKEFRKNSDFEAREAYEVRANGENKIVILQADCDLSTKELDWLNAHHFDYRGLIEKGLALEAPDGTYNKEESEKGSEIPIPKTVEEAVKTLDKIVSKEDRDYLLENGAISMHNSLGRWIRNEWGLWTDSELKIELKKKGFEHPDDMSNYIIEEFIKYLNNKI